MPETSTVGMPTPTGTDWPGLAAGPAAIAHLEVVAHAGDLAEHIGAVADQIDVANRRSDLPVLDQVALRDRKDEVAVGDVDLSAREGLAVDAEVDAADQVLGRVLARRHVGVGHARHRDVAERLAAAVARWRDAEMVGRDAVLHVGGELAVFDQQVAAGRVALVVDVERAAALQQGGVVEHGDQRRGDGFADAVRVGCSFPCG